VCQNHLEHNDNPSEEDTVTAPTRTNPSVGNPVDSLTVTHALVRETLMHDAATVSVAGTPYRGDGIIVALPEHGTFFTPGTNTATGELMAIRRWVEKVAPQVTATASPARYFGAWLDQGKLYLDVVEAYSSAEEDRAIAAARARGQLAIWHSGRQELISTTA
jgi:hypothetical protein